MKDWDRWEEGLAAAAKMEGFRSEPDGGLRAYTFRGRERRESLAADLDQLERDMPEGADPLICVFHGPPYGTALDQIARGVHVGLPRVAAIPGAAPPPSRAARPYP